VPRGVGTACKTGEHNLPAEGEDETNGHKEACGVVKEPRKGRIKHPRPRDQDQRRLSEIGKGYTPLWLEKVNRACEMEDVKWGVCAVKIQRCASEKVNSDRKRDTRRGKEAAAKKGEKETWAPKKEDPIEGLQTLEKGTGNTKKAGKSALAANGPANSRSSRKPLSKVWGGVNAAVCVGDYLLNGEVSAAKTSGPPLRRRGGVEGIKRKKKLPSKGKRPHGIATGTPAAPAAKRELRKLERARPRLKDFLGRGVRDENHQAGPKKGLVFFGVMEISGKKRKKGEGEGQGISYGSRRLGAVL